MIIQQYKIVFAGTMGAGKTEAIRTLSDIPILVTEALNTDVESHQKMQTTVGIDYCEITLDNGLVIGLYGTPGQQRFDFMWSIICEGAIGAIILIDHTLDNSIEELESYLEIFQEYNNDIAIGITHADEAPEKSTFMYQDWLIKNDLYHPLFIVDARVKDDIKLLLEALITSIEINYNITG